MILLTNGRTDRQRFVATSNKQEKNKFAFLTYDAAIGGRSLKVRHLLADGRTDGLTDRRTDGRTCIKKSVVSDYGLS